VGRIPKEIKTFAGSFNVVLGGTRKYLKFKDLSSLALGNIEHEALKEAGEAVKLVELYDRNDNGEIRQFHPKFEVEGDHENLVSFFIGDKRGEKLKISGSSWGSNGRTAKFSFRYHSNVRPSAAVLYIETVKDPIELELLFEFRSIEPARTFKKIERKSKLKLK